MITKLAERGPWSDWEAGGRISMAERAQAAAERLIDKHAVPPLELIQENALDEILRAKPAWD